MMALVRNHRVVADKEARLAVPASARAVYEQRTSGSRKAGGATPSGSVARFTRPLGFAGQQAKRSRSDPGASERGSKRQRHSADHRSAARARGAAGHGGAAGGAGRGGGSSGGGGGGGGAGRGRHHGGHHGSDEDASGSEDGASRRRSPPKKRSKLRRREEFHVDGRRHQIDLLSQLCYEEEEEEEFEGDDDEVDSPSDSRCPTSDVSPSESRRTCGSFVDAAPVTVVCVSVWWRSSAHDAGGRRRTRHVGTSE